MEHSTKTKGNISELKIALKLIEKGCSISFPYGENDRYDLIADYNGILYKIQIKTGKYEKEKGSIYASAQSIKPHRNEVETINSRKSYFGQVDFIGIYCPQLDKCYMVPIEDKKSGIILRVDNPKNNQQKGIILAEQYEI